MNEKKAQGQKKKAGWNPGRKAGRKFCCILLAAAYIPVILMNSAGACAVNRLPEECRFTAVQAETNSAEQCGTADEPPREEAQTPDDPAQQNHSESGGTPEKTEGKTPDGSGAPPAEADSASNPAECEKPGENTAQSGTTQEESRPSESVKPDADTESHSAESAKPDADTESRPSESAKPDANAESSPAEKGQEPVLSPDDAPQQEPDAPKEAAEKLPAAVPPEEWVYRVQYYANIPQYQPPTEWVDYKAPFIDTSAAVNGGRPKLPKNGSEPLKFRDVYLEPGAQGYRIPLTPTLQPLYKSRDYSFDEYKTVQSVDPLHDALYYRLREIWRLKDGADAESTDVRDWDVFAPTAQFAQDPAETGTIQIDSDTVLRFVYDTVKKEKSFENPVVFYDYDVTDGNPTPWGNGLWMLHTEHYGINSPENCKENGASRFAFGNSSIGTDFGSEHWNGNQINRFNDKNRQNGGRGHCADAACYGMVTGIDEHEAPIYAPGLNVPLLFGEGAAIGKTEIDGKSLLFHREGDTYLLAAVKGTDAENLDVFQDNGGWPRHWSNEFWPLDGITSGADPMLGGPNNKIYRVPAYGGSEPPRSDAAQGKPAKDHNNYFGMHCTLEFEASADYVGPLDFFFYGDDDLWAFVDDTLIMDIGGVHCATGMYVDLWDYIPKGAAGKHRINIFFTERGASGSTCYMQFTLPNAQSVIPPIVKTGMLQVEKEVRGPVSREIPFDFLLELQDAGGNPLAGTYPYRICSADGTQTAAGSFQLGQYGFSLKHGESMTVELPLQTKYRVQELTSEQTPPCTTTMQTNDGQPVYTKECSGVIQPAQTRVHVINEAESSMPPTGGRGSAGFLLWGGFLQASALCMMHPRKGRRYTLQTGNRISRCK